MGVLLLFFKIAPTHYKPNRCKSYTLSKNVCHIIGGYARWILVILLRFSPVVFAKLPWGVCVCGGEGGVLIPLPYPAYGVRVGLVSLPLYPCLWCGWVVIIPAFPGLWCGRGVSLPALPCLWCGLVSIPALPCPWCRWGLVSLPNLASNVNGELGSLTYPAYGVGWR